ncbi:MAG: hypothetical protein KGH81_08160, partial [Thaumarchaeota archaeon]|nr:hypothetical protein [Nitrososphaerota archaeon]
MTISAEFALHQIQTLHDEVVDNLAFKKVSQTKIDDFKIPSLLDTIVPVVEPVKSVPIKAEIFTPDVGSINLTNSA